MKWPGLSVRATLLRPRTGRTAPKSERRVGGGFSIFDFRFAIEDREGGIRRPRDGEKGGRGDQAHEWARPQTLKHGSARGRMN